MNRRVPAIALLAALVASPASALPIWSIDNHVMRRGETTTFTVWLTGDGSTAGGRLTVAIPTDLRIVRVRNGTAGAVCWPVLDSGDRLVSILIPATARIPPSRTATCAITVTAEPRAASAWVRMSGESCINTAGRRYRCEVDHGYFHITP